jgi:hypothetical protein
MRLTVRRNGKIRFLPRAQMIVLLLICTVMALSSTVHVFAAGTACPKGMSQLDCDSLYGNWPNWVPEACASSGSVIPPGTLPSIIPEPYNGAFTQGGSAHKVDPALVAAIFTEENFTQTAPPDLAARWKSFVASHPDPNSGWPVSPAGATGPFQFLPSTWTGLGYNIADIGNLAKAADAAADYLASNGGTTDKPPASWQTAIFAYNHAQWYVDAVMVYYNYYTTGLVSTTALPAESTTPGTQNCVPASAVNCTGGQTTPGLSAARQDAVCIAENEEALWKAEKIRPGFRPCTDQSATSTCDSFAKYTQNNDELWCADFVSWVYHIANYPIGSGSAWRVPGVLGIAGIGQQGGKWHYHSPGGYTPKPGDLVIHDTSQHVNMVVKVTGGLITMIGGDQAGSSFPDGSSVSEYTDVPSAPDITGYVSPD